MSDEDDQVLLKFSDFWRKLGQSQGTILSKNALLRSIAARKFIPFIQIIGQVQSHKQVERLYEVETNLTEGLRRFEAEYDQIVRHSLDSLRAKEEHLYAEGTWSSIDKQSHPPEHEQIQTEL